METSWNYDCTIGGDAEAISQEDWARSRNVFRAIDRTAEGVVATEHSSYSGLLAPSAPGGNVVRIASGAALVNGYEYYNDADVDFDVSGGAANATDLIVLRSSPASGLVRLALVRGSAGGMATVTQNATTWEIAIAEVTLDSSGDFSSLADARRFLHNPGARLVDRRQGGSASAWGTPGTTNYIPTKTIVQAGAIQWTGGSAASGNLTVTFPEEFGDTPIVIATCNTAMLSADVAVALSATKSSATGTTIYWASTDGTSFASLDFSWIAYGPPA